MSGMPVPQSQPPQQANIQSITDLFGSAPPSQVSTPPPSSFAQVPPQPARSTPDPFAALSSPAPRTASPMNFQQSIKPQSTGGSGTADLLGSSAPAPAPTSNLAHSSTTDAND